MKLILSRKGFDSGYGGFPSPILPDGRLISFPIPSDERFITYKDLWVDEKMKLISILTSLTDNKIRIENKWVFHINDIGCHLDPDINIYSTQRKEGWKGIFGQAGAAQSHLSNNGISKGDIFLFFGWFQNTIYENGKLVYNKKDKEGKHVIYGYLQVGDIIKVKEIDGDNWYDNHPHARRRDYARDNDYIYIAADKLSFDEKLNGYGIFKYDEALMLTKKGLSKSKWALPDIFKKVDITYHSKNSWKNGYFQSAAKGQEFIVDCNEEISKWVKILINRGMGL
ncbi:Nmad3 family putative nucleotide modification protein [Clostridium hydrogenum]|uniref:Nmad3 family putative nucleotide modification protein n=1 Tax=Clostridium hydrogenum TaxID=2855764 RepID=UPI001F373AFD|nr:hypothetical protein [Clostridium hydrogenum]